MKKTFFLSGIVFLFLSLAVNAQDTTANKPVQNQQTQDTMANPVQTQPTTQQKSNPTTQEQKKYGNPTVDSILSKYSLAPMPNQMTSEQIFPVIGQYQSNTNSNEKVTVTLDDQNKGIAWIDGLPQGRVKAILKKSPATYKIPAQKTADGKDVAEGTMIYDKDSKVINIMVGRPFNDQDPASVFSTTVTNDQTTVTNNEQANNDQSNMKVTKSKSNGSKTKTKVHKVEEPAPYVFTGTKVEQVTATNQ